MNHSINELIAIHVFQEEKPTSLTEYLNRNESAWSYYGGNIFKPRPFDEKLFFALLVIDKLLSFVNGPDTWAANGTKNKVAFKFMSFVGLEHPHEDGFAVADTLPMAICLAALDACGIDVEKD